MGLRLHLLLVLTLLLSSAGLVSAVAAPIDQESYHQSWDEPFSQSWARTDLPVATGRVNRTWMWGPDGNPVPITESYAEAPEGERLVQYHDKSRKEINDPNGDQDSIWFVTNGLLATELITGRMQMGDNLFEDRKPADVQVAGDRHPDSPTYELFKDRLDLPPHQSGSTIIQTLRSDGSIGSDASLAMHEVTAEYYVSQTEHTVASQFWTFMNSSGLVYVDGKYFEDRLFENPFFATGYPITEAYWVNVPVAGVQQDVLVQCFQRRCLTFTPGNSHGWQVEAGNIGQHYYRWRYELVDSDKPAQTFMYSGSGDHVVRKLDSDGKEVWSFSEHTGHVRAVAVSAGGYVYSGSEDDTIRKIDSGGNQVWSFAGHTNTVNTVAVDLAGNVYSGSGDRSVRKIHRDGMEVWSFTGHSRGVTAVAVDAAGNVYSGSDDETVRKIDHAGNEVWTFAGHTRVVYAVAVDPAGNVYTGSEDETVRKLDSDGNQIWSYSGYGNDVYALALDGSGNLYLGGNDRSIHKLDSDGKLLWATGTSSNVRSMAVDVASNVYFTTDDDSIHKINSHGDQLWSISGQVTVWAVAADPGTVGAFPDEWN